MARRGGVRAVAAVAAVALGVAAGAAPAAATDDAFWDRQWAPARIGAPAAWAVTTGGGITIGVVDTGVDLGHEDLAGKIAGSAACLGTGGDPARCGGSAQDEDGHGTHVAGIAAATKDNGKGVAGIAPDARLLVAKVFRGGSASLEDVRAGIQWVVDRGAKVVNLSLETTSFLGLLGGGSADLAAAVEYAWAKGAVPVLAAGNASLLSGSANYGSANAVVVGATGRNDELAPYSLPTGSAKWALVAPGGNIARGGNEAAVYSTYLGNRYAYIEGTSMAVPHVSGALALLLARGLTPTRAVEVLLSTADRGVSCGGGSPTCAGRLDVAKAVAATGPPPSPAAPATAAPASPAPAAAAPATAAPPTAAPVPPPSTAAPTTAAPPTRAPAPLAPPPAAPAGPAAGGPGPGPPADPVATPAEPPAGGGPAAPAPPGGGSASVGSGPAALAVSAGDAGAPAGGSRPAGFRGAAAAALGLLALVAAGAVLRPPAR